MRRRPIEYRLVSGDIAHVEIAVWYLVEDGWWLYGALIQTSTGHVARELVKYAPVKYVGDGGHVLVVGED